MSRTADAALAYAAIGWEVLPLWRPTSAGCACPRGLECASPGKHPWLKWREDGGSTDPAEIRGWYRRWPHSGVAILTGRERSGLWVLDIDPGHSGEETLAALEAEHGSLPATLEARTGSGGRHLVFRYPEGGAPQSAGRLGAGLDTRSDGGLIVAAPSLHRSGRRYEWMNWGTPPADVPVWMLDLLRPTPAEQRQPIRLPAPSTARGARYAEVALERAVADLRQLAGAEGVRNAALNRVAYSLGRLVGGGLIDAARVGHELLDAAVAIGLGVHESEATILSGLRAGANRPKELAA